MLLETKLATRTIVFFILFFPVVTTIKGQKAGQEVNDRYQIKGIPHIIHYTKNEYNADSQFWSMCEDDNGVLYFGNNDGILIYDGESWEQVKLPNGSTVRSLKYASDGHIYAGGYNEMGRILKNEFGQYYFESITDLLRPEDRNFEDIWQIEEAQGYIIFRSFKRLIAVTDNKAITLPSSNRFTYCNVLEEQLFVVDNWLIKRLDLRTLEFEDVIAGRQTNNEDIVSILPGRKRGEFIAFTKQGNSYFIYPNEKKAAFNQRHLLQNSSDQIFCALKSKAGLYYLGTINNQVITLDLTDKPTIENKTFSNLQDNTVLNLFESSDGNIWTLLNKGIDCIEISSPISLVFDDAAIYDVLIHDQKFYIATNQGVYVAGLQPGRQYLSRADFSIIDGLEAQAWSLWLHEGKVVVAHDRGIFVLEGSGKYHVNGTNGVWKVIPIKGYANKYLACAYTGLYLIKHDEKGRFVLKNKVEGFDISSRDIMQSNEKGVFWICHGYKGVFKIKVDEKFTRIISLEHYTDQNGLPSPYNINIFTWQDDTVFTTNKGIYRFDPETNNFVRHDSLTKIMGEDLVVRKILQDGGKTWFIHDDELGYFFNDDKDKKLRKDLFLSLKGSFIKSMELVLPLSKFRVMAGSNNGLYLFDLSYTSPSDSAKTFITHVTYKNADDSLIYSPLKTDKDHKLKLPHNTSSLNFEFATPEFNAHTDIQYSYLLENADQNWSAWQNTSSKEYSYLKSGEYTFRVKSRSLLGEKSKEAVYHFEILPVWYQTNFAIVIFSLIALALLVFIVILVRRKIKKTRIEEQKLRKVLELELEQIRLEQEKREIIKDKEQLEEDVIHKSKELANYTMLLVKKKELLAEMSVELKALKELAKNEKSKEKIRALSRKINFNLQNEEHLQVFDTNFERVHQEFFNELKSNFPDLTQKELRLCGFVKMNLTNKEIASVLNISVRGVETARYRLRKRLSISHEVNMVEFLEKLSTATEESALEEVDKEYFEK